MSVQAGATTAVDGVLHKQATENGKISGRLVVPPGTGAKHVYIYSSTGQQVAKIGRVGTGTYSAWVRPSDTGYAVCFDARPKLVSECSPNVLWQDGAPPPGSRYFPVRAGQHVDVGTTKLHRGAQITGTVRNSAGEPTSVSVIAKSISHPGYRAYAGGGEDGKYNLHRLPPSPKGWRVCFRGGGYGSDNLRPTCHSGAVRATKGSPVKHVDAVLRPGGVIAGAVRSAGSGKPVKRIAVAVFNRHGHEVGSETVDPSGRYTVNSLAAGTYRVCAAPFGKSDQFGGCYRGSRWADGQKPNGDTVAVRVKHTTSGVNLRLAHGATVTGTIRRSGGAPSAYATVVAYDPAGHRVASSRSGSDGVYRVPGLDQGSYVICALDRSGGEAPECAGDVPWAGGQAPVPDGAQPVSAPAHKTVNGPDITLSSGGTVAGTVRDDAGNPLRDQVWLYDSAGDLVERVAAEGKYGYQFEGVQSGDGYRVCFSGTSAVRKGTRGVLGPHSYQGNCYQEVTWQH